jgi:hypothetical protein
MWQVDNRTPFAVEQGWVRDRTGAEVWLVVARASFDIAPDGTTSVSKLQPPPLRAPDYHGEPGKSSIRCDTDFVLTKTTTDVLLIGAAHAPGGEPVTQLDAGFRVGPVQKVLRVFGEREWGRVGMSAPLPFATMPLVYERAFGGADPKSAQPEIDAEWRNPVGRGFARKSSHLAGTLLPNIESPDRLISGADDRPAPAGFGVIAGHWQPRAALAGTYDDRWEKTRQPLLPEDFQDRFFQCAPEDQQAPQFLRGGEPVALLNLSSAGRLHFTLPQMQLAMRTRFMDGTTRIHEAPKLHTVILEPAFPRVSLVWHSAMPCHAQAYRLEATRVELVDALGHPVASAAPRRPAGSILDFA